MAKESSADDVEKTKKKKKKKKSQDAPAMEDEVAKKPDKKKKKKKKPMEAEEVVTARAFPINSGEEEHEVLKASGWDELEITKAPDAKYAITGNENQVITVALGPGETCKGEPGAMMYLSPGVSQAAGYEGCFERCMAGESCFVLNFTNNGSSETQYAALTPNEPLGKVVPVDLSSPDVNGVLIVQQGSYMASIGDVTIGVSWDFNLKRCCCAGTGLARQKLTGTGVALLGVTGTIVQKVLAPGEKLVMDTNSILAFAESCTLDIQRAGGVVGMIGGGEGIFNTTLTGPGLAIVQSMNKRLLLDALAANKMYRR